MKPEDKVDVANASLPASADDSIQNNQGSKRSQDDGLAEDAVDTKKLKPIADVEVINLERHTEKPLLKLPVHIDKTQKLNDDPKDPLVKITFLKVLLNQDRIDYITKIAKKDGLLYQCDDKLNNIKQDKRGNDLLLDKKYYFAIIKNGTQLQLRLGECGHIFCAFNKDTLKQLVLDEFKRQGKDTPSTNDLRNFPLKTLLLSKENPEEFIEHAVASGDIVFEKGKLMTINNQSGTLHDETQSDAHWESFKDAVNIFKDVFDIKDDMLLRVLFKKDNNDNNTKTQSILTSADTPEAVPPEAVKPKIPYAPTLYHKNAESIQKTKEQKQDQIVNSAKQNIGP